MAIRKGGGAPAPNYLPGPAGVGKDGAPGAPGPPGPPGPPITLTPGTITTGAPGSAAAATITGAAPSQTLNLTIPQGPAGTAAPKASIVAGEAVAQGQAVAVSSADGKLYLARADLLAKARALGLARAAAAAGFAVDVEGNTLTLPDWSAVAGVPALIPGLPYFLAATPGQITATAPTSIGQCVTRLGVAASPTTLSLDPSAPVLL